MSFSLPKKFDTWSIVHLKTLQLTTVDYTLDLLNFLNKKIHADDKKISYQKDFCKI